MRLKLLLTVEPGLFGSDATATPLSVVGIAFVVMGFFWAHQVGVAVTLGLIFLFFIKVLDIMFASGAAAVDDTVE